MTKDNITKEHKLTDKQREVIKADLQTYYGYVCDISKISKRRLSNKDFIEKIKWAEDLFVNKIQSILEATK